MFEAKSGADCGISFGGEPTVYVHNGVPSSESVFHVRSLRSGRLVRKVIASFPGSLLPPEIKKNTAGLRD